ncbi:GNAT family N-acetyltransferase [soil metagenome]
MSTIPHTLYPIPGNRQILRPLFAAIKHERPLIDSILSGEIGTAIADHPDHPTIALIYHWCFTILAGDPNHLLAAELVRRIPPEPSMIPSTDAWQRVVEEVLGPPKEILDLTEFEPDAIDHDKIVAMMARVPEGFQIVRMGDAEARRASVRFDFDFNEALGSIENFLEDGIGFCALTESREVAAIALSLFVAGGGIEITVETHPDFQRRGLGGAVAAHLVDYALNHHLKPRWVGTNEVSCVLARRLGFVESGRYQLHEY